MVDNDLQSKNDLKLSTINFAPQNDVIKDFSNFFVE